jgi:hypothetical protein
MVFHVPPTNVDTIFVYSWALSLLCGNANIVRVSERRSDSADQLLDVIHALLKSVPDLLDSQIFVGMSHDDPSFGELSHGCNVRVLWGGDAAIVALRRHALAPHGIELTFPDRSSFVALKATALTAASPGALNQMIESITNDVWWFDQAACSSPRTVVIVGQPEDVTGAQVALWGALSAHAQSRGVSVDPSMSVERRVSLYDAAMSVGGELDFSHTGIGVLRTSEPIRTWMGAGGFAELVVTNLEDIVPLLQTKDQTMTHFGFERSELLRLVQSLGGRALDRVVPVGHALSFDRYWDGYDLLASLTRHVTVQVTENL